MMMDHVLSERRASGLTTLQRSTKRYGVPGLSFLSITYVNWL